MASQPASDTYISIRIYARGCLSPSSILYKLGVMSYPMDAVPVAAAAAAATATASS
jgi:hypothetical protein